MNNFVYICSQQSNDIKENSRRGELYKQYVIEEGYYPVSPSVDFYWIENADPREKAVRENMELETLEQCGQIWVFGDIINEDMQVKIDRAVELKISVQYISEWECAV